MDSNSNPGTEQSSDPSKDPSSDPDTGLRQLRALAARLLDDADHLGLDAVPLGPAMSGLALSGPALSGSAQPNPAQPGPGQEPLIDIPGRPEPYRLCPHGGADAPSGPAGSRSWAEEVREALERFQRLDEWLCSGGRLPVDWDWRAGPEVSAPEAAAGKPRTGDRLTGPPSGPGQHDQ